MKPAAQRVHLHIDRLVLRGVPDGQQDALVAALRSELQARLATPGNAGELGSARNVARVQGRSAPSAVPADASALGRAFGASMISELRR